MDQKRANNILLLLSLILGAAMLTMRPFGIKQVLTGYKALAPIAIWISMQLMLLSAAESYSISLYFVNNAYITIVLFTLLPSWNPRLTKYRSVTNLLGMLLLVLAMTNTTPWLQFLHDPGKSSYNLLFQGHSLIFTKVQAIWANIIGAAYVGWVAYQYIMDRVVSSE